ncbi:MAG: ABC transporter permease [Thermomicrobium sp.]|uniref:ABC transporter permease n=1 Tax=Thermomicrobium sp. TaxID=1969469 RepID=UPI001B2F028F|nr:ABC transporter permease [Thermomicrobium sp.]MBO9352126.1 ABC transporter permease [Thermomicrobium sp.]
MTTVTTPRQLDRDLALRRPPRSLWSDAWRRFRKNWLALLGLGYIAFLAVVAVAAPIIAPHNPVKSDVARAGVFRQAGWVRDPNPMRTGSWEYPLGTDSVDRDVFSRLVYGTRVSLVVGFVPMVFTVSIGMLIGLVAGYLGGRIDNLLMRFTDVVYAFPDLLLFIIMQVAFQDAWIGRLLNGLVLLFITLSLVSWVTVARLVRGEVLAVKQKEFVEAARAIGANGLQVVLRHIVPNTLGPVIVVAAYIVPGAIISEAILSYLGIGIRPSVRLDAPFPTSWGA